MKRTMMTLPPTPDEFKNAGLRPSNLAAQSMTTASNSVHAGLANHWNAYEHSQNRAFSNMKNIH